MEIAQHNCHVAFIKQSRHALNNLFSSFSPLSGHAKILRYVHWKMDKRLLPRSNFQLEMKDAIFLTQSRLCKVQRKFVHLKKLEIPKEVMMYSKECIAILCLLVNYANQLIL